jgi:hypothetical protein
LTSYNFAGNRQVISRFAGQPARSAGFLLPGLCFLLYRLQPNEPPPGGLVLVKARHKT